MTDGYDYISPIHQSIKETVKRLEDEFMLEVTQTIGYDIDKDELIRALQYDRAQYDKGFADGKRAAERHGYWSAGRVCSECETSLENLFEGDFYYNCDELHFCPNCGARMDGESNA